MKKLYYSYAASSPLTVDDSKPRTIRGYAAIYGVPSSDRGGFKDVFMPGMLSKFLTSGKADVRGLVNHDSAKIISRQSNGTLRLYEDSQGLRFEMDVADTSYGNDLLTSVARGDISGMSIGIRFARNSIRYEMKDGQKLRYISEADADEISAVTFPAFEETAVKFSAEWEAETFKAEELPEKIATRDLNYYRMRLKQMDIEAE